MCFGARLSTYYGSSPNINFAEIMKVYAHVRQSYAPFYLYYLAEYWLYQWIVNSYCLVEENLEFFQRDKVGYLVLL